MSDPGGGGAPRLESLREQINALELRSAVEKAFVAIMQRRRPEYRWRALSEEERAEYFTRQLLNNGGRDA